MKISTVLLTFFTLALVFSAISCTKHEDSQFDNYIHENVKSNVKGLDPATAASDLYPAIVMGQVYEGLLQYSYLERPVHPEPLLAESMPVVSKDGLTYTFKIRKGILFHDDPSFKSTNGKGREVEADDFVYSWKRLADPALHSDGFWMFDGKIKGMTEWRDEMVKLGKADYTKPILGLETPDKYTLVIKLIRPYPQLLYILTMTGAYVLPHEAVENYGPELQNHPVGTGPYKFRSWVRNAEVILDRNPNYHDDHYPTKGEASDQTSGRLADAGKKLPLNDGVVFTEMYEDQPRILNFKKGVFDWIEIPKDSFDSIVVNDDVNAELKAEGVTLNPTVDGDLTFDSFNMDDPIVGGAKNKYLRQAMSLAVNTKDLINKFYFGHGVEAQGPIPPGVSGYDPKRVDPYKKYDLAKAKELMKKAGYPNGEGLPEILYETYSGSTNRQIAEYFQQEMSQLGIKIKINMNTWPQFIDKTKLRKAQMFGMAWSADYPDGENFLQLFYGKNASPGPNSSNYNNPEYNKLFEQASVMQDSPARTKIYQKMVDIVVEDCPWIFDVHRMAFILTHGWFHNYKRNLTILNYIKYYRIDKDKKAELKKKL
jgi:oligopeptide transport system substrate-binding protein